MQQQLFMSNRSMDGSNNIGDGDLEQNAASFDELLMRPGDVQDESLMAPRGTRGCKKNPHPSRDCVGRVRVSPAGEKVHPHPSGLFFISSPESPNPGIHPLPVANIAG
ncbi:hypothetical protein PR202_ga25037 [Eleusine coracana subsp. coracana]|uniref:Uncharacterized protein n=1 Tax=Eleusine coracana subsp. coracana TaxID=191504 RepID=A0AAV5DAK8_ELECO|nr:hypothetical protein PR202_ga25037 [Eleusine coracana subsp. coracana]